MAARGVGRERRINESGIQQTVVAFDVTLKMPTSQQGTAAFCPPSRLALPLGSQGVRRDPAGEWPRCGGFLLAGPGQAQFSAFISHFPSAQLSLERDGRARVLLPTPARKYLHPRECFEKGGLSNPAPAILIGGGVRFSFPTPALGERCHRVAHGGISLAYVPRRKAKPWSFAMATVLLNDDSSGNTRSSSPG